MGGVSERNTTSRASELNPFVTELMTDRDRVAKLVTRIIGSVSEIYPVGDDNRVNGRRGCYIFDEHDTQVWRGQPKFTYRPRVRGVADSAHTVLMGNITSHNNPDMSVAAKHYNKRTFEDRLNRVNKECEVMLMMKRASVPTIEPIAVIVDRNGDTDTILLLTKEDPSLITLDNNPWGLGMTDENIDAATRAANALGRFNVFGICHNDAKIKNVASSGKRRSERTTNMIDFETAEIFDIADPVACAAAAQTDLTTLINSLQKKGLFPDNYDGKVNNSLAIGNTLIQIFDKYLEAWTGVNSDIQTAVYNAAHEVIEGFGRNIIKDPRSLAAAGIAA